MSKRVRYENENEDDLLDMLSNLNVNVEDMLAQKIREYPRYEEMLLRTFHFWKNYGGNKLLFQKGGSKEEFSKLLDIIILIMDTNMNTNKRLFGKRRTSKRRSRKI